MNKNPVWLALLLSVFAVFLWFAASLYYPLKDYYALTEKTEALNMEWFVEELSSEDFRVGADYSFIVSDNYYKGQTIFSDQKFRNPSSADDELKIKAAKKWVAYYDPQNIHHSFLPNSSLQKKFPTKECVSTGLLLALLLYFTGLGMYARTKL